MSLSQSVCALSLSLLPGCAAATPHHSFPDSYSNIVISNLYKKKSMKIYLRFENKLRFKNAQI